jgi:tetratricopeptide (TPR) repeat protein
MHVYDLARQAYATYLSEFQEGEHIYNVRYAYGELMYKLKDYVGAFEQYMAVVAMDPNGKHSLFCAESAIFAAEEQVKKEGGALASGKVSASATELKEPQDLTEWEGRLVEACAQFARLYPDNKKSINAIYKSGYMLYNKYRFEEAADQFKLVITMDPRSGNAATAAELILDSFVVRKNWQALKDNSKFYYDMDGLGGSQFKKDAYEVYERSSFKVIEVDLESDKDKLQAAGRFVAFYEEFPEATTAAQALNNASIYYYESDKVNEAVQVRHILVEDPKFGAKTKYYYDQVGALGFDYETIADFDKAAHYYEQLWDLFPEESKKKLKETPDADVAAMKDKAGDALYSAAVFRNGLGSWQTGIDNYNTFTGAFPTHERVAEIKMRVARIYEENEQWDEAANVYKAFYTKPPEGSTVEQQYFSRLHYGQLLGQQGKTKEQRKIYEETISMYGKHMEKGGEKGAHTEFVAEMMYMLALPTLENYMTLRIAAKGKAAGRKAEDKALSEGLTNKALALNEVQGLFTQVVGIGAGEWGLAALVSLGQAYENMGVSLRTSDRPFYLTEEQEDVYTMTLEDKAYVQDEKAVNAYQLALEKSFELTIYNDNTAYATRQLGVLRADEYPGLQESLLEPTYTSSKSTSYELETGL